MPPSVMSPSLLIETYLDNVWKQSVPPPPKRLGMEALCQYLTGVNFLMYEQYMKIQITSENQPKADWKAVISNFQKAWVIWFPSKGNNSTGINLWMVLDNLNKSSSPQASCMANIWCGLSKCSRVLWDRQNINMRTGENLSHLPYWGTHMSRNRLNSLAFWAI